MMQRTFLRPAIGAGLILLIPFAGTLFGGWLWGPGSFVAAFVLLFGAGLMYELVAGGMKNKAYRFGAGLAVATALILLWVNAAAGIIGDGPVNLLYLGVPALGAVGAFAARLEPGGMARTLFAMALAQMLVPVLALVIWNPPFDPGIVPVFILNGVFAALWTGSALLFLRARATGRAA